VHGARVGDLARAVDPDEPSGLAMSPGVEREDRVAPSRESVSLDERVHLLPVAGEPVEEDDRRPTACWRRAVRDVERRGDRDAVVHPDGDVLPGRGRSGGFAGDQDEGGDNRR
jgi:hypothetical protein